jgi:hypothetical protein
VHQSSDFGIAEALVGRMAELIGQLGIGMNLFAALASRPILGSIHEQPAHPLTADVGIDVPAFDIADAFQFTVNGARADCRLQKTAQATSQPFRNEGGDLTVLKCVVQFIREPLGTGVGPKGRAQPQPLGSIRGAHSSNSGHRALP